MPDFSETHTRNKSLTHEALQKHIAHLLEEFPIALEKRFPSIGRIADVVWEDKKFIFEIQCSPMSRQEMIERTASYRSLGYQVVWILHEKTFNQYKLTSLEAAILDIPHYFSNLNPGGEGIIYDQCCFISKGIRIKTFQRIPIDLSQPKDITNCMRAHRTPRLQSVERRLAAWQIHFGNDLISLDSHSHSSSQYQSYLEHEKAFAVKKESLWSLIKKLYLDFLDKALKSHCG